MKKDSYGICVCIQIGVLFSFEKEGNADICCIT